MMVVHLESQKYLFCKLNETFFFNSFALRMYLIYGPKIGVHMFQLHVCALVDGLILYTYFLMIFRV